MADVRLAFLAVLAVQLCLASSLSLPSYIVPCHKDDPDINKCFIESTNAAIPHLRKGDKRYNLPALDPLVIPEASIKTQNLKIDLTNISVYNLDTLRTTKSELDIKRLTNFVTFVTDKLNFRAHYKMEGKILSLPISGEGTAKVGFVNPVFKLVWIMGITEINGVKHFECTNASLTYDVQRATYEIDNLFNGNKELGDNMNKILNENWRALHEEFAPILSSVTIKTIRRISGNLLALVPMDEIFI